MAVIMIPLYFDAPAEGIVALHLARDTDAALQLDLVCNAFGDHTTLVLDWTNRESAEQDARLIRWHGPHGVPIFIAPRLWRYLVWHPLHVRGRRIGPFRSLVAATGPRYLDVVRAWERTHPCLLPEHPAA